MDDCSVPDVRTSPNGKYTLTIEQRETRAGCWNHSRGAVRTVDGREIVVVDRNYSAFPFAFVEGHPDGHDYLVCGANYQGQTLIRLDTGERWDHVPPEAMEGCGFCFADMMASPDGRTIAVEGCYWAAPYEVRMYDFAEPRLPLLLLGEHEDCNVSVKEWASATECIVGRVIPRRISDGANCNEMTVEAETAAGLYGPDGEYDPAKVSEAFEGSAWRRPSYEHAADKCRETLDYRIGNKVPLHVSWVDEYAALLRLAGKDCPRLAEYRAIEVDDATYRATVMAKREARKQAAEAAKAKVTA